MRALWRYIAHEDPLVAAGNTIALVLGYNTPLYPVYLWWIAGWGAFPAAWLTLCSCPLFLCVPAVARRSPLAARIVLPVVGTTNTMFCTWIFGAASGTSLFLIPCVTLAALLFRPRERLVMLCVAALPIAAFAVSGLWPAPLHAFSAVVAPRVVALNAASVGILGLFLGAVFSRVYVEKEAVLF
jgi:hypothetical protein